MEGRLGKYDLLERLATGGMAELFLARSSAQHGFEKTVVLKRILPAFAEQEDFIRMFMAEAQLAASLHHPNIAQVFDFGEEDGTFYFTMEYVPGLNLRQLLAAASKEAQPLALGSALHIVVGVAAGLHHAHEHRGPDGEALQIVHRDVSPSNVLVTYEGNVKLVDFGIAKISALGPSTVSGSLKGKIAYMSPEQCRGELVDRRSDIFSLGTLLWELTTGRKLFSSNSNELALLQKVERAVITPPSMVVPNYPSELEQILLKAMARDRDERFETALDMRLALEEFAHTYRVPVTSTRVSNYMDTVFPRKRRRVVTMTSSMPALQSASTDGSTDESASPTVQIEPADELTTGEEASETTDLTDLGDLERPRRKPMAPWAVAAAAVVLVGLGGYALGGGSENGTSTETKAAAASGPEEFQAPEPTREDAPPSGTPSPDPAPAFALAEPDVPPRQEAKEDVDAGATHRSDVTPRRRKKKRREAAQPQPPLTEPPKPESTTLQPTTPKKRKSDGVFLPTRPAKSDTSNDFL